MKLEELRLKNFKAFKDIHLKNIPRLCILVGANGTGKSTLFSVFGFLKDALADNVHVALAKLGGGRGFHEVRTRGETGAIEIELKFRIAAGTPLISYSLSIDEVDGRPVVASEILKYRRLRYGRPWHFLEFAYGSGRAVTNEPDKVKSEGQLDRENFTLKSPDILAVKGLTQFDKFPATKALGDLIERWHVSDFHIQRARPDQESGYAEQLSREGENLALVVDFLHKRHGDAFKRILDSLKKRVPGVSKVEAKTTEEGRVMLRFQDGAFADPFLARNMSDGTIKMLAYLVLLNDPSPHPLLCIEEPENQLYPTLLEELAEEFRDYARRGGQVFVSTHSPDFLNAAELDEVFWFVKRDGYTTIRRASDDPQLKAYVEAGDQLGYLWKSSLFEGADPV